MFCPFCGKEIGNQARFCGACGKALTMQEAPAKKTTSDVTVWYYIFGAVFILMGILPYLLREDYEAFSALLWRLDVDTITAANCISNFSSYFLLLFRFSSSVMTVFVGFLLLKKASNLKAPMITCAVLHGLSVLRYVFVNLMLSFSPETVLSWYTDRQETISAGLGLLEEDPELFRFQQNQAITLVLISFAVLALIVVFLRLKARHLRGVNGTKINTLGSILMIISVASLRVVNRYVSYEIAALFYGNAASAGVISTQNLFSGEVGLVCLFIFLLLLADAVLLRQSKSRMRVAFVVGGLLLLGAAAYALAGPILMMNEILERTLDFVLNAFQGMVIGGTAIFIAVYLWFRAVSGNRMPTWVQIVWPLVLPTLYFFIEFFTAVWLRVKPGTPYCLMAVACLTLVFSSFRRSGKKTKKLAHTQ